MADRGISLKLGQNLSIHAIQTAIIHISPNFETD